MSKIPRPWNRDQGSLKVIETGTIQQNGYGFLLVFHSNFVPIRLVSIQWLWNKVIGTDMDRSAAYDFTNVPQQPYRLWDKQSFQSKIAIFSHPRVFCASAEGMFWASTLGRWKTIGMELQGRERSLTISSAVWIQYTNVTDGQTDGRQQRPRLRIVSRGNKRFSIVN